MQKYLKPDEDLAVKYICIAILIQLIDYYLPYIGVISLPMMFIAIKAVQNPENKHFDRAKKNLIYMFIAYFFMRFSFTLIELMPDMSRTFFLLQLIGMGISYINFIYVTHYFTEGIQLEIKKKKLGLIDTTLNRAWIFFGAFLTVHMVLWASTADFTYIVPIPEIEWMMTFFAALYYVSALFKAGKRVYEKK